MSTPLTILILEDNPSDAELMVAELRRAGYKPGWTRVDTEADFKAGLNPALQLILADYNLPQFTGLQALDWMKRNGLDTPFILVSGSIGEEQAVAAMKQGASDYLMKDRLGRLGPAVAGALEQKRLRSAKQQAETALAQQDRRFRALVEHSSDAITLLDANQRVIYDSPSAPGLLGYGPKDWIGQDVLHIVHPEDAAKAQAHLREIADVPRGRLHDLVRVRHGDGSWVWLELVATNMLAEPAVGAIVLNYRDVTPRVQAEAEREALLEIMTGVGSTGSLNEFLELVRRSLSRILPADNLFVVLHDKATGLFEEVFAVDQYDAPMPASKLEKSITSYVFRTGEPVLMTQAKFEELRLRGEVELVGRDSPSWLGAPLKTPQATIGVIVVQDYKRPDCYTERDRDFLASVGAQVALAIERKRAEDDLQNRARELQVLYETSQEVAAETSLDKLLVAIVERAAALLGTDSGALYLMEPDGQSVRMVVGHNLPQTHIDSKLKLGEGISGAVAQSGNAMQVEDYETWPGRSSVWDGVALRRVLALPLKARDELIGVINVADSGQPGLFSEDQIRLGSLFANQAAMAIQRRQAEEKLAASEAELRTLFAAMTDVVVVYDREGRYVEIAPTHPVTMPAQRDKLLGRPMHEVFPKEQADFFLQHIRAVLESGQAQQCEYSLEVEGKPVWFSARAAPRSKDTVVWVAHDVTSLRQAAADLGQQVKRLAALHRIDEAVAGTFDIKLILRVVLDQAISQLGADAANFLLLNPVSQTLEFAFGEGFRTDALRHTRLTLGQGHAGQAALGRSVVHVPDLRGRETDFLRSPGFGSEGFVSYFAVPLIAKGVLKGVLEVFHRKPFEPDAAWSDFLETLASQAAVGIDSAGLYEEAQRSSTQLMLAYDATIEGWSRALDLRDKETEGHTQRVADLSLRLAGALGMRAHELVHLRRGALLHDIGKMGIPDSILQKPGPLSDEEWVIMKRHPEMARNMLAGIRYLEPALQVPYCHHEKWDGSGYPRGLRGEQIPLSARVFAVVDVFDALTSDRPYRPAWSRKKAAEHIGLGSGSHFDPAVVGVFLRDILGGDEEPHADPPPTAEPRGTGD